MAKILAGQKLMSCSLMLSLCYIMLCFVKHLELFCEQIVDDGAPDVCKFWRNQLVIGTLADGKGIGKAEKGEAQVNQAIRLIPAMNRECLNVILQTIVLWSV